jgi:hypothetical protein
MVFVSLLSRVTNSIFQSLKLLIPHSVMDLFSVSKPTKCTYNIQNGLYHCNVTGRVVCLLLNGLPFALAVYRDTIRFGQNTIKDVRIQILLLP